MDIQPRYAHAFSNDSTLKHDKGLEQRKAGMHADEGTDEDKDKDA